jgi:hypothetical protein
MDLKYLKYHVDGQYNNGPTGGQAGVWSNGWTGTWMVGGRAGGLEWGDSKDKRIAEKWVRQM